MFIIISDDNRERSLDYYTLLSTISDASLQVNVCNCESLTAILYAIRHGKFKKTLCILRSMLLQNEFPSVSRVIRHLPEFILTKPCKKCPLAKKKRKGEKFHYAKRYVLAEGAHLTVSCPE